MLTYCHAFLLKRRFQKCIWQVRYCTARTVKNVSYFLLVTHKMPTWSFLKKNFFHYKATGARWGKRTNWNPKCQSISECFLIGNVSLYWDDTYRTNAKPVQYEYTHKGEGRLHSFCQILEDLHNDAFFSSTLQYSASLNNSAFIYWERWNNVTPKSFTMASWLCAQLGIISSTFLRLYIHGSSQFKLRCQENK